MPAFPALSDAQVNALVEHMRGWSDAPTVTHNTEPVKGDAKRGEQLFAKHCEQCHGENGKGGTGTGVTFSRKRELPIIAPALNNSGFLAAATDTMIKDTLIYGREGTPMTSSLVTGLTETDIDDLVSYIRSFEAQPHDSAEDEVMPAVIVAESPYTVEETIENLKAAITDQNFTLIRTDYVEHGFVEEGKENKKQVVLHFCNFNFLFQALAIDPRVGVFLPCRVTVTEQNGKVQVATINPMRLSGLFNNDELKEACKEMTGIYEAIIEDAVL
jgi:cytochrome c oxidase cbb3-type subunit 3